MTVLTREDVAKLRRTKVRLDVPNEVLVPAHTDMQEALTRDVIAAICRENILGNDAIEPFELVITEEGNFFRNMTVLEFRWEPTLERYEIELSGGPADGKRVRIPEHLKGTVHIQTQSYPELGNDMHPTPTTQHTTYTEDGWDTESKVWIYTPKN